MTIRRRITVATAVAVAVTVVLVSLGAYLAARRQLLDPIDESLERRAAVIAALQPDEVRPNPGGFGPIANVILRRGPGEFDAVYYQAIFPNGGTINIGEDVVLPSPPPRALDADAPTLWSAWVSGVHVRIATVPSGSTGIVFQLGRPLTEADVTLRRLAAMLAIGGIAGIAVAIGLGALVSRRAVRPIEDLTEDVAGLTGSEALGRRVAVDGDDEVAQLAGAFNLLLGRLEDAKAQQVRLVRDAGHELRTPLTALRTNLEVLRRHDVGTADRETMLAAATAEVEELSELVGEIVDLATDRYVAEPLVEVQLTAVVEGVGDRLARRNGRVLRVVSDDSVVQARHDAVERAVANIVANADAWSPDGAEIEVTIEDRNVTVADHGPGFAEADLPHVFERFYRSDLARTRAGSGLGLSIVEQIVTDHGGEVFARNRDDGTGAIVGFSLPG